MAPLWKCKRCGRRFANASQTHTCRTLELSHHFVGKPPEIRRLYNQFVAALRRVGRVIVLPEKTRVAFQVRMSFAQVTPRRAWLDGHLVLARRAEEPVFRKVETFSARNHLHAFRIHNSADIEALEPWLKEAYAVGQQKHLNR